MSTEDQIRCFIRDSVADYGKVPCKVLLDYAKQENIPPALIGRLCDEMDIRVSGLILPNC